MSTLQKKSHKYHIFYFKGFHCGENRALSTAWYTQQAMNKGLTCWWSSIWKHSQTVKGHRNMYHKGVWKVVSLFKKALSSPIYKKCITLFNCVRFVKIVTGSVSCRCLKASQKSRSLPLKENDKFVTFSFVEVDFGIFYNIQGLIALTIFARSLNRLDNSHFYNWTTGHQIVTNLAYATEAHALK